MHVYDDTNKVKTFIRLRQLFMEKRKIFIIYMKYIPHLHNVHVEYIDFLCTVKDKLLFVTTPHATETATPFPQLTIEHTLHTYRHVNLLTRIEI